MPKQAEKESDYNQELNSKLLDATNTSQKASSFNKIFQEKWLALANVSQKPSSYNQENKQNSLNIANTIIRNTVKFSFKIALNRLKTT